MAYVIDQNGRVAIVRNYSPVNFINPNFVRNHHPQQLYPLQFALHPAVFAQIGLDRSISLKELIKDEGLVPSQEEEQRRNNVIRKLRETVTTWIKKVARLHGLPPNHIRAASATILTYGSCGLGVYNAESDIDALCVGPWFASLTEDFFVILHDMLAKRVEVSDIHCIKDAKVPLMRFKFEGIAVDLPYAQLQVTTVPENVDTLNFLYLNGRIDETSWKSLSGVRANNSILQLVPNVEIFQELLRCVKLWAKRRGVYGNLFGFFGGVHLAVLSALICQRNPNANLAGLLSNFFKTFFFWPWPTPVILHGIPMPRHHPETRSLMPIHLPSSPHEYCHSNVTRSTLLKIRNEFRRGFCLIQDLYKPQFDWRHLFEPYPYSKIYQQFLKITLSSCKKEELGDWVGWVKSRFRCLLLKLEELGVLCDPNPSEHSDTSIEDPNIVYYWGLDVSRISSDDVDIELLEKEFKNNLGGSGFKGVRGKMTLSVIQTSESPKNFESHQLSQMGPNYFVGYCGPGYPGVG